MLHFKQNQRLYYTKLHVCFFNISIQRTLCSLALPGGHKAMKLKFYHVPPLLCHIKQSNNRYLRVV